ncbi:MAG: tRNA (adenosine(37)-N6)-threonylcarbamoyltransferase complex dimerization subunit type 1 TsaB [Bacteroidales bacterium]|nr:tRNA (adenosine(37)-N6)-threonylcarbamoyltransferase complex dimerization subunit type 1 TsaB [Bacteroidales bacterium]
MALCDSNGPVSELGSSESKSHASRLTLMVGQLLHENGISAADLDAVAVSRGPGSYTGLRIGVSAAKGIAFGASLKLIAVDTTLSMFNGIAAKAANDFPGRKLLFCPMLDARRMEVYYALYGPGGELIKPVSAGIINEDSFADAPSDSTIIFFGDGAGKCSNVIRNANAVFLTDFEISASFMFKPAYEAFNNKRFEDLAYFEPLYLKDFLVTTQRKNILQ